MEDREVVCKLLLLGCSQSGKTSFFKSLANAEFTEEYRCTIGLDYTVLRVEHHQKFVNLLLWDSAGRQRFQPMKDHYLHNTDGVFIVYSIADRSTFDKLQTCYDKVAQRCRSDVRTMLVGAKSDLDLDRKVAFEEGKAFADRHASQFIEVSAKCASNVKAALMGLFLIVLHDKRVS